MTDGAGGRARGPIAFMARRRLAANLILVTLVVGGLIMSTTVKQEVFPEVELNLISVTVAYPGAGPEEVEEGIVLAVEEAIRGIDGVDEVRATASEDLAVVWAEVSTSADARRVLDDIKSAVDRITSLPQDAERPIIALASNRVEVISLVIYGDADLGVLERAAERARAALLADPRITQVDIDGLPPPEISIEVPQATLRRYQLTLPELARLVGAAGRDIPAGEVQTEAGDVLLRLKERKERAIGFESITVRSTPQGGRVTIGDIGQVIVGYRDLDREAYFNGKRAVRVRVFRIGDETPLDVAGAVHEYVARTADELPPSLDYALWADTAELYQSRVSLLLRNAALGAVLVICVLGLFLRPRIAFWVTLGIPISFLGAFLFMGTLGVSINMISLFAFILCLGIVVDDAIVVGEAIDKRQAEAGTSVESAVAGTHEVAYPVSFAVLTTITAFVPLLFIPGLIGEFFDPIPLIVIPVLALSLVEAFFVLPAHLAHRRARKKPPRRAVAQLSAAQQRFRDGFDRAIDRWYRPLARRVVRHRYPVLAGALGVLIVTAALVAGNRIRFRFLPDVEGDTVVAQVRLPFGVPVERTREVMQQLARAAQQVVEETGKPVSRGIYAQLGAFATLNRGPGGEIGDTGGHLAEVAIYLKPASDRGVSASQIARRWRQRAGELPGVESLEFQYEVGPPTGADVSIELSHADQETLRGAAQQVARQLAEYRGVVDVDEGFEPGKPQLDITLTPLARGLGLTEQALGEQVRGAFYGAEALRQQRGREELRVYVRLPEAERRSLADVEQLIVRTPRGGELLIHQAADVVRRRAETNIERLQGRRVVEVTGEVDPTIATGGEVTAAMERDVLPKLLDTIPGLSYRIGGEQRERTESMAALATGMAVALIVMYAMLALAANSYIQPLVVMFAIPFGALGAIAGHAVFGRDLSIISVLGMVALSGVVVNDSLVLIAATNHARAAGQRAEEALVTAGTRRFRPILLTSLTTFFGLMPMILETSVQAQFLVPMALSLGCGVLFVTVITLFIVPAAYMVIEDARQAVRRLLHRG